MESFNRNRQYGSDTFTKTANLVFKILTVVFILVNYAGVRFILPNVDNKINMSLIGILSVVQIILAGFIEPLTYKKRPLINFAVNILIAASCGLLLFSNNTYISVSVFFTNIVTVGLRLPVIKSVLLTVIYYMAYTLPSLFISQRGILTVFFDIHILILFLSIVYLCYYFSRIEDEKVKQDETIVELVDEKVSLSQSLGCKNIELYETYWDMVETLIGVIGARDSCTGGHSVKVCEYSVKLSKKLGLNDDEISNIMKASILHDIGKMGIPDNILLKPDSLSADEYNIIMNHPEIGCKILSKIKGLENVMPMILYHHERIDGKGYPFGIDGDKIPVGAKIIAIADAYDAMTSNRPYRKALLKKEAKKRLTESSGTQFYNEFVEKFIQIIDEDNIEDIKNYRYVENIKKNAEIV